MEFCLLACLPPSGHQVWGVPTEPAAANAAQSDPAQPSPAPAGDVVCRQTSALPCFLALAIWEAPAGKPGSMPCAVLCFGIFLSFFLCFCFALRLEAGWAEKLLQECYVCRKLSPALSQR